MTYWNVLYEKQTGNNVVAIAHNPDERRIVWKAAKHQESFDRIFADADQEQYESLQTSGLRGNIIATIVDRNDIGSTDFLQALIRPLLSQYAVSSKGRDTAHIDETIERLADFLPAI